jgi:hypothetical protein
VNILGIRTLAPGMLMLVFAGCSSTAIPMNQSAATSFGAAARIHPNTTCPDGGSITLNSGDNGTHTLGIGDTCILYGPGDQTCALGTQDGYKYLFVIGSGSYGTLSGTTQSNGQSKATFKRTSGPGNEVIDLKQSLSPQVSCHEQGYAPWGYVTFN